MGHSNTSTTQQYLRFQPDELIHNFPSLKPIIEEMENVQKTSTMATKSMATKDLNSLNLHSNSGR